MKLETCRNNRKWGTIKLLLIYIPLFLLMFFLCWGQFYLVAGKTTIWEVDGFEHEYSSFVYTQKYIRHVLKNIFINHNFVIPSWDYSIGYGSSVYTTFDGFHNPVKMFLMAIVPFGMVEGVYQTIAIIRLYLVGASFIVLAKAKNKSDIAAIAGAFIYNFSITTSVCLAHSEFSISFFLMPLLLLAVDDLWKKKFSAWYIVLMTMAIYNSYYYFYMICIALVLYCIHKYCINGVDGQKSFRAFWSTVFKFVYHSVLAVGMGAVSFLPAVLNMMNTDRLDIDRSVPILYIKDYYGWVFQGFANIYDSGNDWYIGFGAISVVLIFIFFTSDIKKHLFVKLAFFEMSLGIGIPFVGHAMNGFSYSSNRWVFMYLLGIAYIAVIVIDEFEELSQKRILISAGFVVIYGVLSVLTFIYFKSVSVRQVKAIAYAAAILSIILVLVCLTNAKLHTIKKPIAVLLCAASLFLSAADYYNPSYNYHINTSVPWNEANNLLKKSDAQELLYDIDETEGSRYDFAEVFYKKNASWTLGNGHSCMDFYRNLYTNNIDRMNKHLAVKTDPFNFSYRGVDERAELDALYGVKYFTVEAGEECRVPVIYEKLYKNGESYGTDYSVYSSTQNIGMAYLFDKAVDYDTYMSLEPIERQQVLMQAVVIEDGDTQLSDISLDNDEIHYYQDNSSTVLLDMNKIVVDEENNEIVLNLDLPEDLQPAGEWYIYFKNYQNIDGKLTDYYTYIDLLDDSGEIATKDFFWSMTPKSHMYGQKHDWLINLGACDNCKLVRISIERPGIYTLDDLKVYYRTKSEIIDSVEKLQNAGDLKLFDNEMTITANADTDKYLFISEPYNEGWRAYIDGEKAHIYIADDAFMAVEIPAGEHSIIFKYHTPNMALAIIVSIMALILSILAYYRVDKRSNNSIRH